MVPSLASERKIRKMIVDDEIADVPPANRGTRAANLEQVMQSDDMMCYRFLLNFLWTNF